MLFENRTKSRGLPTVEFSLAMIRVLHGDPFHEGHRGITTLFTMGYYYSAFQVQLAVRRAHLPCNTYKRRAATSLLKNVGGKRGVVARISAVVILNKTHDAN